MKRIMLIGRIKAGKTSFLQALRGEQLQYKKTQTIELIADAIDTPGEYLENRTLYRALVVTAADADMVVFVQSAVDMATSFAPGLDSMFTCPTIGIVTKIDAAEIEEIARARRLLELAGCKKIFLVSNADGQGIHEVKSFLEEWGKEP